MEKITKRDLAKTLAKSIGCSMPKAINGIDAILDEIKNGLANGVGLEIRGFGSMRCVDRKAKTGQDINKGTCVIIPACKKPVFKPSEDFTAMCNK